MTKVHTSRSVMGIHINPRWGVVVFTLATLASGVVSAEPAPSVQAAQACAANSPSDASLPGIEVNSVGAETGGLPALQVIVAATGAQAKIFYDPLLEGSARSKAACFGELFALLAPIVLDPRRDMHWDALILTTGADYVPHSEAEKGWSVQLVGGRWSAVSMDFLLRLMPHEWTHDSQKRRGAPLPRWFEEGDATWAGLHVTEQVNPVMAADYRKKLAGELAKIDAPHLAAWGGIKVKPEAIKRQLTAEDRARMAADPTYHPKGPFTFAPSDLIHDDYNQEARYAASLDLFDGLERRHGRAAVQAWVTAVLADKDNDQIVPLAKSAFGEDITTLLK